MKIYIAVKKYLLSVYDMAAFSHTQSYYIILLTPLVDVTSQRNYTGVKEAFIQ